MSLVIELNSAPDKSDVNAVHEGLSAFNRTHLPFVHDASFALFLRSDTGKLHGGVTVRVLGQCLYLDYFWLSEGVRGKGWGEKIMNMVEQEGKNRNVNGIYLDTYTFQASQFYKKLGFIETGRFCDFPVLGVDKIFLCKRCR